MSWPRVIVMRNKFRFALSTMLFVMIVFLGLQNDSFALDQLISSTSKEFATGLNVKIMEAIAEELNLDLQIAYASFARKLALMEEGKIDISAELHRTIQREKFIHFIEPSYWQGSKKCFFVRKGKGDTVKHYDDLYPLRIGTSINVKYFDRFDSDTRIKKIRVSKTEQKFKMLLLGRIDAVIHSHGGALKILDRMGIADKVEMADYYYSKKNPVYIGVSKRSPLYKHIEDVEPVMRKMIENGQIRRIITKYYSDSPLF